MTEPYRERPTARVLLLDPDDRILLMKGRLPSNPDAPGVWFTIGGGIEPGESLYEAAAALCEQLDQEIPWMHEGSPSSTRHGRTGK